MGSIIDLNSLLFHLINLVVLYVAVRHLLYKPLVGFMSARAERFANERAELDSMRGEAEERLKQGEAMLLSARQDAERAAAERMEKAEQDAAKVIADAENRAREHAELVMAEAEESARRIHESAHSQVAKAAIGVASKVLKRELDRAAHQEMIDDFLSKVD